MRRFDWPETGQDGRILRSGLTVAVFAERASQAETMAGASPYRKRGLGFRGAAGLKHIE